MNAPKFAVSLMCMDFAIAGEQVDTLSRHADSFHLDIMDGHFAPNTHAFRTMNAIRSLGMGTGLVLNPLTTFDSVTPLLERIDILTIMTIDIGFAGQPFIDEMLGKIEQAAKFKTDHGLNYEIQIDGSCSEKTFAKLRNAGAETFILGNAGLFSLNRDLDKAWATMRANYERTTGETLPAEA